MKLKQHKYITLIRVMQTLGLAGSNTSTDMKPSKLKLNSYNT